MANAYPLIDLLHPAWAAALPKRAITQLSQLGETLARREQAEIIVPRPELIFRAMQVPPDQVRVLIVGQDPYPNPAHACGLAFSSPRSVAPPPASARNILRELSDDVGLQPPGHADLSAWANRGVILLNRHLTTAAGQSGGHHSLGWEVVTDALIDIIVQHCPHSVAILWGRQAATLRPRLGSLHTIESAHPSPLSARRGFFGSRPFSRANAALVRAGQAPVDWALGQ